jgi:hypothetical protein
MKKRTAIEVLGGNAARAARAIGCSRQNVSMWPVDEDDNITSKHVIDAVLAALVRMNYMHYLGMPDAKRPDVSDEELHDLMHVPDNVTAQ